MKLMSIYSYLKLCVHALKFVHPLSLLLSLHILQLHFGSLYWLFGHTGLHGSFAGPTARLRPLLSNKLVSLEALLTDSRNMGLAAMSRTAAPYFIC